MKSRELAEFSFSQMLKLGIDCVILCSGARNAPLTKVVLDSGIQCFDFFQENDAGFFALGLAKQGRKPAVICTSGTAVAQFLSPCAEAFYDSQFILFVSADRPKSYRGTGAPQSMNQSGLLKDHCSLVIDVESVEEFKLHKYKLDRPMHWNLCFDAPLWWEEKSNVTADVEVLFVEDAIEACEVELGKWNFSETLLLISRLQTKERGDLESFLDVSEGLNLFIEASSGISRTKYRDKHNVVDYDAQLLSLFSGPNTRYNSVIHIGGVPTTGLWRILPNRNDINVLSIGNTRFSGLPGVERFQVNNLKPILNEMLNSESYKDYSFSRKDPQSNGVKSSELQARTKLNELVEKYPKSEIGLYSRLAKQLESSDYMYLANSSCIRLWEMLDIPAVKSIDYNRGLNGIDGQLASFMGAIYDRPKNNFGFFGDLSFFYDLSGIWPQRFLNKDHDFSIYVMNNSGGKIFDRIFANNPFANSHEYSFKEIASFYSLNYSTDADLVREGRNLIELFPDDKENKNFWKEWKNLWD